MLNLAHIKIVLTISIGGVLVLVVTALFLLFKVGGGLYKKLPLMNNNLQIKRHLRNRKGGSRQHFPYNRRNSRDWEALEADGIPVRVFIRRSLNVGEDSCFARTGLNLSIGRHSAEQHRHRPNEVSVQTYNQATATL